MNFGAILAGGTGSRMNNDIPKQFIDLCGKPIILHTLEKMVKVDIFDYLIIAIHPDYVNHLKNLLEKFGYANNKKIVVITGGKERLDTIENVINATLEFSKSDDDVLLLHDAVRPFVTKEILKNSVSTAKEKGACVAVVPVVDTVYQLSDNKMVSGFPARKYLFNGQAPDTFQIGVLKNAFDALTDEEKKTITGTVQICAAKGVPVSTIEGSYKNMKITTNVDLAIAKAIFEMEREDESLCAGRK